MGVNTSQKDLTLVKNSLCGNTRFMSISLSVVLSRIISNVKLHSCYADSVAVTLMLFEVYLYLLKKICLKIHLGLLHLKGIYVTMNTEFRINKQIHRHWSFMGITINRSIFKGTFGTRFLVSHFIETFHIKIIIQQVRIIIYRCWLWLSLRCNWFILVVCCPLTLDCIGGGSPAK